ncbi:MAG: prolyl oligopeptidase family serine peptidase, partial [Gemmatimonadota bacterium]|nr:prolyl oligopeptidase family serine peptidase [Gemmatimonadota bacterium]
PFLDRIELATGKTTRLWRSEAPHYESVIAVLDPDARQIITRRESLTEPPNAFLRDVRSGRLTKLTDFKDPAPQFAGVTRELIKYNRADGVELSATLYLPAGYDRSRGPLPFLFWAYPREFKTAAAAAQVRGSPYKFVRPQGSSHLFLLTQGYGVLDDPAMPIVGEGTAQPNDTYIEQLVAGAKAAVDEIVRRGVADRDRIAIGGHSYGAFMTANLLAHSDLFRTGIARSGAYNRTLTPFGFQAEERDFWKAQDTYMKMSPFTYAHQINEPVLMIHGEADNNSGTFPVQSERMFAAIKGNGGVARFVLLPAESHGYRARESVGHVLWEMVTWLDRYVKDGKKTAAR